MKKRRTLYLLIFLALAAVLAVFLYRTGSNGMLKYAFMNKSELTLALKPANPFVKTVAADPSNKVILKVEIRDRKGMPVSNAHVKLTVDKKFGAVSPQSTRTDENGEVLVAYTPSDIYNDRSTYSGTQVTASVDVEITAGIPGTQVNDVIKLALVRTPVIFVHGYQSDGTAFNNMKDFLTERGYQSSVINYNSTSGVKASAKELEDFISAQTEAYAASGLQVEKFDLIAHSMGGLTARYYTCSTDYVKNNNVRKIIFISVPHKGSLWASLGANYFTDQAVKDMIPDSQLISNELPGMLNKGLNSTIQTANLLGQYDEVVTPESANLEDWNIKTEMFNIGQSNMTVDNILNGSILESAIHKSILNNRKVYEKVDELLGTRLPYPSTRRK